MSVYERAGPNKGNTDLDSVLESRLALATNSWSLPRRRLEQSIGKYDSEAHIVEIIKSKGKLINQMGFTWKTKKCLLMEEALFLVDQGYLLLFRTIENATHLLSLQDVYLLMIASGVTLRIYSIYADLKSNGYIVYRYPMKLNLMKDEKPSDLWKEWSMSSSRSQATVVYCLFGTEAEFRHKETPCPEKLIAFVSNQQLDLKAFKQLKKDTDGTLLLAFSSQGEVVYYSLTQHM